MKRPLQLLPLLAGLAGIAVVFPVLFLGKGVGTFVRLELALFFLFLLAIAALVGALGILLVAEIASLARLVRTKGRRTVIYARSFAVCFIVASAVFLFFQTLMAENDRNLDRMQRTCQQEQLVGKNKDEVSILFGDPDQIHDLKDGSLWTYDVSTLLWRELDIGLTPFNIRFDKEGKVVDFGFRKS